jgi:hypothetical protein
MMMIGLSAAPVLAAGPATANLPSAPPRVILMSDGDDYTMKRGPYCSDAGCVAGAFPRTRRTLKVDPGGRVRIRVRSTARRIQLEQLKAGVLEPYADARAAHSKAGRAGRSWFFRVHRDEDSPVVLGLSVVYLRSTPYREASFGGRLRPR